MANCFKPESWTAAEETLFLETQQRRARVLERRKQPVLEIANDIVRLLNTVGDRKVTDYLINNAEKIVDALRPYDSGVRPAETEAGL